MTLLPRSLLARTLFLLAALIVASQLIWLAVVRYADREPRAAQIARQAVSVVALTRSALIAANRENRRYLLTELHEREGIRVYPAAPNEPIGLQPNRPFFRLIEREIKRQLGADTQVALDRQGLRALWVSFNIDDDRYWVAMPRVRLERSLPLQWIVWGGVSIALALLGAWFIVWRVNRPLRALAQAAEQIGKGEAPPPLQEEGAEELRILTRKFNQMNSDLARFNQERTVMLAGLSHDLRTPLARLRLATEMLPGPEATRAGMVQDIEDMDAIIGQFLAFVRGAETETPTTTDLNALIRELCERYARSGKAITLELSPLPPCKLRPMAMQRLLGNLLDNAFHHGSAEATIRTERQGDTIVLAVLDRGPGIAPQDAATALQPFARLDSARSGHAGAGLGLAIVERIAQMHGGKVALLSRPGGGLEVQVTMNFC
jgi:two-component system, OmpR family, osmolarity sensor histidine kinase EnvZ